MVREWSCGVFYRRLKEAAAAASFMPLHIFVSTADVDSLCSLKICVTMLGNDGVRYSVFPVSRFSDLDQFQALRGEEPLVVLLINLGASQDLCKLLNLGAEVRIFVVDSHRPVHLRNFNSQQVIVLYTDDQDAKEGLENGKEAEPPLHGFNVLDLAGELLQEDEGSDDEEEEPVQVQVGSKRRRSDGEEQDGDDEDDDGDYYRNLLRQKRRYYASGTSHSRASGRQMFSMAYEWQMNTNDMLWLACVALTDQFVHGRITQDKYRREFSQLSTNVNVANADVVTKVTLRDGTVVGTPSMGRITKDDEPRLMLLREWTLYDSMVHSPYVATKFKTWNEKGLKKMHLFLASMGISLKECQQKFMYMSRDTRGRMKQELTTYGPKFGVNELYYPSFQRHHGYCSKVSAADVVYGIAAFLELESSEKDDEYWNAFKALPLPGPGNWEFLQRGMQLAIKVQLATIRQGNMAMTKPGFIKTGKGFRWIKLDDGPDLELIAHPLALTKLCYFIMDALKEQGVREKPILCAARRPNNIALVLAVLPRTQSNNRFGVIFRRVADSMGLEYEHHGFDSSWIRMEVSAVGAFMVRVSERL